MSLTPTIVLTILFAPLVAFVIQILFGHRLFGPKGGANRLAGAAVSLLGVGIPLALVLIYIAPHLFEKTPTYFFPEEGATWIDFGSRSLRIGLMIDNTTKVLLFMVTLVCTMIHLFASEYMKTRDGEPEPRYTRFFAYLSLFTFSMLLLTLSDNLLMLFIGWELMGLCSYLLIGFYYEKKSAQDASLKAFMTTRVGDVLLFLALAIFWTAVGSLRFPDLAEGVQSEKISGGLLTLAGILALGGAIGKSAQFPLHTWLPDAMEGPTPVSALIHAATMVAAGVYLAARMLQAELLDATALLFIAYIGGFTAVFAASIAFVQTDIKRVLAYSTISQLGYMMLAVGVGNYTAAIFHLIAHAFFKACLFLGSGSVIHAMHEGFHHAGVHADAQDMRNMGGLRKRLPWTYRTFLVATLALSGVPFTVGFLSKDAILAGTFAYALEHPGQILLPIFGFVAALMTAFYMFRLVFMTFFGEPAERAEPEHRAEIREAHHHVHESSPIMVVPLVVLALFSLWAFWSINPLSEGWMAEVVVLQDGWLHVEEGHSGAGEHHVPGKEIAMALSLALATLGILLAVLFYGLRRWSPERFGRTTFAQVLEMKYGFDEFYGWAFVRNVLRVSAFAGVFDLRIVDGAVNGIARVLVGARYSYTWLNGAIDRYVVDGAVNGVARLLRVLGTGFRRLQTGMVQGYLLVVFTGLVVLVFILSAAMR